MEPTARYEQLRIPLAEPRHGISEVSATLGIPDWWPTGDRVAAVLAHGTGEGMEDPLLESVQQRLTEARYLTLRFNFPFWEGRKPGKRTNPDPFPVLEQTYRTAISMLSRDPANAPAHLFLGGKGLGAEVAARLATARLRLDGLFFVGLPLHRQDKPATVDADYLYRIVSPMLFVQGTRDRRCEINSLRRTLLRIGAPTALQVVDGADQNFRVLKKSDRTNEEVKDQVAGTVTSWIAHRLGEA